MYPRGTKKEDSTGLGDLGDVANEGEGRVMTCVIPTSSVL